MNQEQQWREEFEKEQWLSIEMNWLFLLGSHHKKLVEETALNIYLAARKKAQEEIDRHKNNAKEAIQDALEGRAILVLARDEIKKLKEEIEKRDRILEEANKLIKKSMMKNKDGKIEWLKQYEEVRGER